MADPVSSVQVINPVGCLLEYNTIDNWDVYQERLDQYFIANSVGEDRKVAVLLMMIGQKAYITLRDVCDPVLPKNFSYKELCEKLAKLFSPKVSIFRKRIVFYDAKQVENETVNDWYVRVKNLAAPCQFKQFLEDKVKDKFVTGLRSGRVLDRLCEEAPDKSLQEMVEIAVSKEVAVKESAKSIEIHKVKKVEHMKRIQKGVSEEVKVYKPENKNQSKKLCYACGKDNHAFAVCRYKKYSCKICKKIGHLAAVCRSNESKTNFVEEDGEESSEEVEIYHINNFVSYVEPFIITVEVVKTGQKIDFELDSGAGVSIIPSNLFEEKFRGFQLEKTKAVLKTYDNRSMEAVGKVSCVVKYLKKEEKCTFIIVKGSNRNPLFGRDLMKKFDLEFNCKLVSEVSYCTTTDIGRDISNLDLRNVLDKYSEVFKNELGTYKEVKVDLEMETEAKPIFCNPRPIPFAFKSKVEEELNHLEKEGVITKIDNSSWGTPLVVVIKENGGLRLCGDYRTTINKYLKDVNHPLPRIDELFVAFQGGECFTKLDFRNAYNQLIVEERTGERLSWSTHLGIYKVNRLPYGTKPACQIFQREVEKVLKGLKGVINFMDDILVTGINREDHINNLRAVLERLKVSGFRLNLSKCKFFQQKIKYLGHIIDKFGLAKDPEKVKAIKDIKEPKTVTEVKSFIGMVSYYAKFIPNLSKILKPLYELLKKGVIFRWSGECVEALKKVKEAIMSDQVLVHFNTDLPVKLMCDASGTGLGAVLFHTFPDGSNKPISFASRVLSKTEQNYSVIHKEALAIYWGVRKFYQYLMGRKFELISDHKPLQALFGEKKGIPQMAAGRLQRWALFLCGFNYVFTYIKGQNNCIADCLSRLAIKDSETDSVKSEIGYLNFVENSIPVTTVQIQEETLKDLLLCKVLKYVKFGWPDKCDVIELKPYFNRKMELDVDDNIIMWGHRVIIPSSLRSKLLYEIHSSHMGINKMKALARGYFWWPSLDKELENLASSCHACLMTRSEPNKATLIKWEETTKVFERVHIDYLGPIKGRLYFVLTDAYSKWPEVFEVSNMQSESTVNILRDIFSRFGIPCKIVSDNAKVFLSKEFQEFCINNGIIHVTSPPYHPASNGAAENSVKSFKRGFEKALHDKGNSKVSIETLVSRYLFWYRNAPHSTTGKSPATLMIGRPLRNRLNLLSAKVDNREKAGERQRKYYNGKRNVEFSVKEYVYARDYVNPNKKGWRKCQIVEVISPRVYMVKDLSEGLLWKRHANQIIKCGNFYDEQYALLKDVDFNLAEVQKAKEVTTDLVLGEDKIPDSPGRMVNNDKETEGNKTVVEKQEEIGLAKDRPRRNVRKPDRLDL